MPKPWQEWTWRRRSPTPHGQGSSSHRSKSPIRTNSATVPSHKLLDKALQLLSVDQRNTVQRHITAGANDLVAVVSSAQDAAMEKKKACIAKQWTLVSIGGRDIKLRQVADTIVKLLDSFKAVGDVASNADPIHAGLPWAGLRLILQVAVSEHRQMCALLVGMEMVLCMVKRLQAYMNHLARVPACLERMNLEEALVYFYACILGFLADAIEAFSKSTLARVFDAFLSWDTFTDFQERCLRLADRTETEASMCDRLLDEHDREEISNVRMQLEKLRISLNDKQTKIDFNLLPVAEGAEFDSYEEQHLAHCYPNTRTELLRTIYAWAADSNSKGIFWLNGMAGTGKSTVSRTVAKHWQEKGCLGASFFFKRGEGERGNGRRFFTTLVFQLFQNLPELQKPIADILETVPDVGGKSLQQQFEKLFLHCFMTQNVSGGTPSNTESMILVIDALDECESSDVNVILGLLRRVPSRTRLRIFLTSRPELPIRLGFSEMGTDRYQDLVLHMIAEPIVEHDVMVLLNWEFDKIRATHAKRQPQYPLPSDWPSQGTLKTLVERSMPLFIYAVTVCRFIANDQGDPVARLDKVLLQHAGLTQLDQTYLPVLEQLFVRDGDDNDNDNKSDIEGIKLLLGVIAVLEVPLPIKSLARLLELEERYVARKLDLFQSVLWIPDDPSHSVRLFHLSFRDFLVQKENIGLRHRFAVLEQDIHRHLVVKCLKLLTTSLNRDMCLLKNPGYRRANVSQHVISDAFSPETSYACRYWTHHLCRTVTLPVDFIEEDVHAFVRMHMLHWLESLSWLGQMSESQALIMSLISKVNSSEGTIPQSRQMSELDLFLKDSHRFIITNRHVIEFAPLQLYASCLLFAPDSSLVKAQFKTDLMLDLAFLPKMDHEWTLELQRLEIGNRDVDHVQFSPGGEIVAVASQYQAMHDYKVTLWNVTAGTGALDLEHPDFVSAIAFSSNGASLVSASGDGFVRVWNVCDGSLERTFTTPSPIHSLSCHPDFKELAMVAKNSLHVCCIATGEINHSASKDGLLGVVYSPDGRTMALQFRLQVCIVRNDMTEKPVWITRRLAIMAFSPDSTQLALSHDTSNLELWSTISSETILRNNAAKPPMSAISFSPSGKLCATGSWYAPIYLWHVETGKLMFKLEGHDDCIRALSFSGDGSLIASASDDGTTRTWNVSQAELEGSKQNFSHMTADLEQFKEDIGRTGVSSDGHRFVVSPGNGVRAYEVSKTGVQLMSNLGSSSYGVVYMSPNGEYFASSDIGLFEMRDVASGNLLWDIRVEEGPLEMMVFSPDSSLVALTLQSDLILVVTATGDTIRRERLNLDHNIANTGRFNDQFMGPLAISADNQVIAYSRKHTKDFSIQCRHLKARTKMIQLNGHDDHVTSIAFSNDMQYVASASTDGTTRLWQISTGSELWQLNCRFPTDEIMFSADDSHLRTDSHVIRIEKPGQPVLQKAFTGVQDEWIQRDEEDVIWLPHLFQRSYHEVKHDMVIIMTPIHFDPIVIKFRT